MSPHKSIHVTSIVVTTSNSCICTIIAQKTVGLTQSLAKKFLQGRVDLSVAFLPIPIISCYTTVCFTKRFSMVMRRLRVGFVLTFFSGRLGFTINRREIAHGKYYVFSWYEVRTCHTLYPPYHFSNVHKNILESQSVRTTIPQIFFTESGKLHRLCAHLFH